MLASMLYCSSIRGSPEVAVLAPDYFSVLCSAISQLCIPQSEVGQAPDDSESAEEWAFQTVLGIILAGLLREAVVKETGVWISLAYRLILEYCPSNVDERSREWRRLFSGLQVHLFSDRYGFDIGLLTFLLKRSSTSSTRQFISLAQSFLLKRHSLGSKSPCRISSIDSRE